MFARPLCAGDTIGIASPSALATPERYAPVFAALEGMGYRVKPAHNLYAHGWGYAASDAERAADLNQLIHDDEVAMIFFGGGEGADDVLPLLDYEAAARHPKRWLTYSDGTSILNALHDRTGLTVYYGQAPTMIPEISAYNLEQFRRFLTGDLPRAHLPAAPWRPLTQGAGSGELIGGYLDNFIYLCGAGWVRPRTGQRYVLFLEDHEQFFGIEHESDLLARLESFPILAQTSAVLFGHYSEPVSEPLLERLTRLGRRWKIPVCYCDDFGHGRHHAILPIGACATLDADRCTLTYMS